MRAKEQEQKQTEPSAVCSKGLNLVAAFKKAVSVTVYQKANSRNREV